LSSDLNVNEAQAYYR